MWPRVRNGDMLRLAPGEPKVIDNAPSGRIYKDGKFVGDYDELGISNRRKLSFAGHVSAQVLLNGRYEFHCDPMVNCIGLPLYDDAGEEMEDVCF